MKIFSLLILFFIFSNPLPAQITFGQPFGPEGSTIRSLAKDSSGNFYAAGSRMYKSTNQGTDWTVINSATNWSTIAVTKSGVIYAGTTNGGAVMRSTNDGQTWEYALGGFGQSIHSISVDQWGTIYVGSNIGLFKSIDGLNFTYVESVFTNITYDLDFNPDGVFFAATMSGIFTSTDYGATWKYLPTSLANTFALEKNTNGIYYAAMGSAIYRSDDRCSTWTKITDAVGARSMTIVNDINIFVGGFNLLLRSTDGGSSWINLENGIADKNIQALFAPSQNLLMIGNRIGIYASTNQGTLWQSLNSGLGIVIIRDFVVAPNGHYFAGTIGGVFRSTDGGETWKTVNNGLMYQSIYMLEVFSDGTLFVSPDNGLYRSTNDGDEWVLIENAITDVASMVSLPSGTIIASQFFELYRSTNNGISWTKVYTDYNFGGVNSFAVGSSGKVYGADNSRIIFSKDDGITWGEHYRSFYRPQDLVVNGVGHFFITDDYNGVFRSTDEGLHWKQVSDAPNNSHMLNAVINKNGYIYASNDVGDIFESKNNGKWWSVVSSFPGKRITELYLDSAGFLYVVISSAGVYKSEMSTVSSGLPNIFVTDVYDFGRKKIVQQHDTLMTIYNLGTDTLRVHSVMTNDSLFSITQTTFVVPPYGVFDDTINYTVPFIGYRQGNLFVHHNSLSQIETVQVSAFGYGVPKLRFSVDTLDFNIVERNYSKDSSVVVYNDGDDTLTVSAKNISPGSFKSKVTYSILPQRKSIVDTIRFTPQNNGLIAGTMIVRSNTEENFDTLYAKGFGQGFAMVSVNTKNIIFGKVPVGKTKDIVVYFFNPGYDTLKVNNITSNDSSFFPSRTSFVLQPITSSAPVTFTYRPDSIKSDSAIIRIYSNTKKNIDTLFLYGIGDTPLLVTSSDAVITTFGLHQNYPNPFNPATTISFQVPEGGFTTIKLFDMLGREIKTLFNGYAFSGKHTMVLNAEYLSPGVYCYTMSSNSFYDVKKMILLK